MPLNNQTKQQFLSYQLFTLKLGVSDPNIMESEVLLLGDSFCLAKY